MTTVNAHVTHGDKTTYFDCWSLSHAWGKLKSVTFFATMPHVKQVLAAFDDNGMFYIPGSSASRDNEARLPARRQ